METGTIRRRAGVSYRILIVPPDYRAPVDVNDVIANNIVQTSSSPSVYPIEFDCVRRRQRASWRYC